MDRRLVIASVDKAELSQLRQMLTRLGYRVVAEAISGMNALKAIRSTMSEVVLMYDY